jgi:hypothetical protein
MPQLGHPHRQLPHLELLPYVHILMYFGAHRWYLGPRTRLLHFHRSRLWRIAHGHSGDFRDRHVFGQRLQLALCVFRHQGHKRPER